VASTFARWRNGRLVQHVVHAVDRAPGNVGVGQVAQDELYPVCHTGQVRAGAGDQVVHHANVLPAADQFLNEMRTDEPRATGHQVRCHSSSLPSRRQESSAAVEP
jgi:hypothetical protein